MRDKCIGPCGRDNVEIVAHGLCARCHLAWWRASKREQAREAAEIPGAARPDKSQKRYQRELSEQRIMLCKVVRSLEMTPVIETALSHERVASIIKDLNQAIRIIDNVKDLGEFSENSKMQITENLRPPEPEPDEFSENQETELSENPKRPSVIRRPGKFSDNSESEFSENSEPDTEEE